MDETRQYPTHPVWAVYELYRTVRFNKLYYTERVLRLQRIVLQFDICLAIIAPTSAVAALPLWSHPAATWIWQIGLSIAAVVSIVRPLMRLTEKLEKHQKTLFAYRDLHGKLDSLTIQIRQDQDYDDSHRKRFDELAHSRSQIEQEEPVHARDTNLAESFQERVNRELPPSSFYIPAIDPPTPWPTN